MHFSCVPTIILSPLHPHCDPVDLHVPVERGPEVVITIFVRARSGDDARVHEGRHGEVDQYEDGDNALEYWDSVPLLYDNVPLITPKHTIITDRSLAVLETDGK